MLRSSIGGIDEVLTTSEVEDCKRRLEFSTGSSSGLGSSLNSSEQTTKESDAAVTASTTVTTADSVVTSDKSTGVSESDTNESAISGQASCASVTSVHDRDDIEQIGLTSNSEYSSILAPMLPGSTTHLEQSGLHYGKPFSN